MVFNLVGGYWPLSAEVGFVMPLLTIPEAAKRAGVNVKTLRKHVKMGRIPAIETPLGLRISEEALVSYGPLQTIADQTAIDHDRPGETTEDQPRVTTVDPGQDQTMGVPLAAHLAALEFAERRLAEERARSEEAARRLDEVERRADQAERSRLALEWQLQKYQAVLAESAESLAEERALRMTLEAKTKTAEPKVELRMATSVREKGWGQRLKTWLGLRTG